MVGEGYVGGKCLGLQRGSGSVWICYPEGSVGSATRKVLSGSATRKVLSESATRKVLLVLVPGRFCQLHL